MDRQMCKQMDRQMYSQMDRQMDSQMDIISTEKDVFGGHTQ